MDPPRREAPATLLLAAALAAGIPSTCPALRASTRAWGRGLVEVRDGTDRRSDTLRRFTSRSDSLECLSGGSGRTTHAGETIEGRVHEGGPVGRSTGR